MGACLGGPADPQDRKVQGDIDKDRRIDEQEIKLLLLGAGGSGKSTLFKQLNYIHGEGFNKRQKLLVKQQIYEQLIESMKTMVESCEQRWEEDPNEYAKYRLFDYETDYDDEELKALNYSPPQDDNSADYASIRESAEAILKLRNNQKNLSPEYIAHLQLLWNNPVIQSIFAIRNEICVPDSTAYFMNDFERITAAEYVPTDTDLLMVRYRTTGMQEKNFLIRDHKFKICDVGGQRNERRKWIHFFSNVTSVIFVVSLSCYDELTFEDEENAMVVSIAVFDEQVNSEWFADIPFILFLNKSDLYNEKILNVPIKVAPCFSDYSGPTADAQASLTYIKEVFNTTNKNQARSIFTHVTNATNKDQIEKVFNDVQTMIINWSLERAGLT